MDDAELQKRIRTVNIFARVVPEQKLRLVNALKANGEIVAMTGDGVNDAPALKVGAHRHRHGRARHRRGPRGVGLVLLDDDFSSIVQAVRLGRRIFDNLKKADRLYLRHPRADRRHVADPGADRLAAGSAAGAYRLSGTDHRPGLFDCL